MEKTEPTVRLVFAPEDGPSLREVLLYLLRALRVEPYGYPLRYRPGRAPMGARRGLSMRWSPPGNSNFRFVLLLGHKHVKIEVL